MKRFAKIALGAVMLVGAAAAVASPASAQVSFGIGVGPSYYGPPAAPVCDPYSPYYDAYSCAPAYNYYSPDYYYAPDYYAAPSVTFGFGGGWDRGHDWRRHWDRDRHWDRHWGHDRDRDRDHGWHHRH